MKTVDYQLKQQLPIEHRADVIVVGGGPGGLGAAVMAARQGADVLLIERYGQLGGMASFGGVTPFMHNHVLGEVLDGPVCRQWHEQMQHYRRNNKPHAVIHKAHAALAAEDLCLEAGVRLLYHHGLDDVLCDGDAIDSLVLLSKSGHTAAKATMYIDCTGDADLAALAGCEYEQGDAHGKCQPMTTFFTVGNIDLHNVPDNEEIQPLYQAAKQAGKISCPQGHLHVFDNYFDNVIAFNWTRVLDTVGTSGSDLSKAEIEARKQIREVVDFMRSSLPGFENACIHSIAQHVGIRETRRVRGIDYITRDAFAKAQKFPDAIARVNYPIDIHSAYGGGVELVDMPEGEWYEIPYGCVVARDRSNLLVGGRPISVDHAIHSSMRIMPVACSTGQAAGVAAALATAEGTPPAQLDGTEIRRRLKEAGANL